MTVGEQYALASSRSGGYVRVTLIAMPEELRPQRRVLVRLEEGVSTGKVRDVPSRSILAQWSERDQKRKPEQPPARIVGPWPPEPGAKVRWASSGGLHWIVDEVDPESGRALIHSKIFGRPQEREVPLDQLRPVEEPPPPPARQEPPPPTRSTQTPIAPIAADDEGDADIDGDDALERVIDKLVFDQACHATYRRHFARRAKPAKIPELLVDELRRRGRIVRRRRREYMRIEVPRRFAVVIYSPPSRQDSIYIRRLQLIKPKKAKPRSRRSTSSPATNRRRRRP